MLGRFLEYSIPTADIRASLDFYLKLGFSAGRGRRYLDASLRGGHRREDPSRVASGAGDRAHSHLREGRPAPAPRGARAVRCRARVPAARQRHIQRARLGRSVGTPGSPGRSAHLQPEQARRHETSLCGYFEEIALPSADLQQAKGYWEKLGFVGMDELEAPLPRVSCTSDSIDLGLYEPSHLAPSRAGVRCRRCSHTLKRLADEGVSSSTHIPPPLRGLSAGLLIAPEGTPILLMHRQPAPSWA